MVDTIRSDADIVGLLADNTNEAISAQDLRDAYVSARGATSTAKTGAYTATLTDRVIFCDATSAAFTVTLPTAASSSGYSYAIKKIDSSANAVTIDGNGSETIDGATTHALSAQYNGVVIQSDGTEWFILADV